jgi:hypothetical protein
MAVLDHNDTRCPRCGFPSIVLSATELWPGFEYVTLRCTSFARLRARSFTI